MSYVMVSMSRVASNVRIKKI